MKKSLIPVLILLLLLSGCATVKESFRTKEPYTAADRAFQAFAIGAQVADYTSTKDALSRGCIESSPVLGERPSDATLIAAKLVSVGLITWVGNNTRNHIVRKWWYGTMGLLVGAVSLHNYNINCNP